MTTSDLAAVEALLLRVLPNPMGFAENVLGELAQRLGTDPSVGGPTVVPGFESDAHEALVDRNMLLAVALGACECWGDKDECPGCGGLGSAGWAPPDPELYEQYVAPAVRRSSDGPSAEPAAGTRLAEAVTAEGEAR
jgi:hypothetical protein